MLGEKENKSEVACCRRTKKRNTGMEHARGRGRRKVPNQNVSTTVLKKKKPKSSGAWGFPEATHVKRKKKGKLGRITPETGKE